MRVSSGEEVVTLRGEIRREIAVNQEIYERDKEGKKKRKRERRKMKEMKKDLTELVLTKRARGSMRIIREM